MWNVPLISTAASAGAEARDESWNWFNSCHGAPEAVETAPASSRPPASGWSRGANEKKSESLQQGSTFTDPRWTDEEQLSWCSDWCLSRSVRDWINFLRL